MAMSSLDLIGILSEHEGYHVRLKSGEFEDAPDGTFDNLLASEHLQPIINAIGVMGIGKLLHIAHELAIQVFKNDALQQLMAEPEYAEFTYGVQKVEPEVDPNVEYVKANLENVANWFMMAKMMGAL